MIFFVSDMRGMKFLMRRMRMESLWFVSFARVLEHILEKDLKDIKSGRLKPQFLPADYPTIRPIIKQEYDRKRAIGLFNQVYDFLLIAKAKYLKQEDCDEHHKKFGT